MAEWHGHPQAPEFSTIVDCRVTEIVEVPLENEPYSRKCNVPEKVIFAK